MRVRRTKGYLVICIVIYGLTLPLFPIWLPIDCWEKKRAGRLFEKMDQGYVPNWWDEITCSGWERY